MRTKAKRVAAIWSGTIYVAIGRAPFVVPLVGHSLPEKSVKVVALKSAPSITCCKTFTIFDKLREIKTGYTS